MTLTLQLVQKKIKTHQVQEQITDISWISQGGDSDKTEITWVTPQLNNANMPLGDYKGGVDVSSIGADQSYKISLRHYTSGNAAVQTLGTSASQSSTGAFLFTLNVDPIAGATGDRIAMFILGSRGATHGNQTCIMVVNDVDSLIEVPFDAAAPAVVQQPLLVNQSLMI